MNRRLASAALEIAAAIAAGATLAAIFMSVSTGLADAAPSAARLAVWSLVLIAAGCLYLAVRTARR